MKSRLNILPAALLVLLIVSCGKTTEGKMSGEWKVTSYEEIGKTTGQDDYYYGHSLIMDQATGTYIMYNHPPNEPIQSDTIPTTFNSHTMTIKEDGTWKRVIAGQNDAQSTYEISGTWNFVRKNKEESFKKNERVLFNVLSEKSVTNGAATYESTYLTGQYTQIYNVTESTKKKLILELESGFVDTDFAPFYNSTNVSEYVSKVKIVLEEN